MMQRRNFLKAGAVAFALPYIGFPADSPSERMKELLECLNYVEITHFSPQDIHVAAQKMLRTTNVVDMKFLSVDGTVTTMRIDNDLWQIPDGITLNRKNIRLEKIRVFLTFNNGELPLVQQYKNLIQGTTRYMPEPDKIISF